MQNRFFFVGILLLTVDLAACSWQSVAPPTTRGIANISATAALGGPHEGFKAIYAFPSGAGGQTPSGAFTFVNGTLFGTALYGGKMKNCTFTSITPGCGLIFSIDPSGHEKVIYTFKGLPSDDGIGPVGTLLLVGNKLYGETVGGGLGGCSLHFPFPPGCGTIYEVDTAGNERVIYRFKGGTDGENPGYGFVSLNGILYGTTTYGGTKGTCAFASVPPGCGVVFSIDQSGHEKVIYRFKGGPDGAFPGWRLVALKGTLYGTTHFGGGCSYYSAGCGTVFKVTPSGAEAVIYAFKGMRDGQSPGALIAVYGSLYGTTVDGGCLESCKFSPLGTIFKVSVSGKETIIHRFAGGPSDSMHPQGQLVVYKGTIYGTGGGGANLAGAIFSATLKGGVQIIYSFAPPPAPYDPNGLTRRPFSDAFYGGSLGGKYNAGYVYRFLL